VADLRYGIGPTRFRTLPSSVAVLAVVDHHRSRAVRISAFEGVDQLLGVDVVAHALRDSAVGDPPWKGVGVTTLRSESPYACRHADSRARKWKNQAAGAGRASEVGRRRARGRSGRRTSTTRAKRRNRNPHTSQDCSFSLFETRCRRIRAGEGPTGMEGLGSRSVPGSGVSFLEDVGGDVSVAKLWREQGTFGPQLLPVEKSRDRTTPRRLASEDAQSGPGARSCCGMHDLRPTRDLPKRPPWRKILIAVERGGSAAGSGRGIRNIVRSRRKMIGILQRRQD